MTSAARDSEAGAATGPEVIAAAYLAVCEGDAHHALVRAIGDALADLCEAERRCREQDRLVSHGYARSALGQAVA